MKVKDLVEVLNKLDENLEVYGYSSLEEGGGDVEGASVQTEFPYCGGDAPEVPEKFVLISIE